jgi:hypothetical protein
MTCCCCSATTSTRHGDPARLRGDGVRPFADVLDEGAELLAILGNHDVAEGPRRRADARARHGRRYWARTYGDVLVVGLDSTECRTRTTTSSSRRRWRRDRCDLAHRGHPSSAVLRRLPGLERGHPRAVHADPGAPRGPARAVGARPRLSAQRPDRRCHLRGERRRGRAPGAPVTTRSRLHPGRGTTSSISRSAATSSISGPSARTEPCSTRSCSWQSDRAAGRVRPSTRAHQCRLHLRRWNLGLTVLHAIQAVLILVLSPATSPSRSPRRSRGPPGTRVPHPRRCSTSASARPSRCSSGSPRSTTS